jgi:hypothetical protein
MKKTYYVYHDGDHGDIEIFTTLALAKAHAEEQWPQCDDGEGGLYPTWEGDKDGWSWGEYVTIDKKKVKA